MTRTYSACETCRGLRFVPKESPLPPGFRTGDLPRTCLLLCCGGDPRSVLSAAGSRGDQRGRLLGHPARRNSRVFRSHPERETAIARFETWYVPSGCGRKAYATARKLEEL